jgi:hypothetical protein
MVRPSCIFLVEIVILMDIDLLDKTSFSKVMTRWSCELDG